MCVRKETSGISAEDIAKRLMDYGFHAPTMSFPVAGTLMVEPTESESQAELDRFVDAMISIREEIAQVERGERDREDNVLKNAPHTAQMLLAEEWLHDYPRQQAAYLVARCATAYWPPVARVDNAYGDRNLVCAACRSKPTPEAHDAAPRAGRCAGRKTLVPGTRVFYRARRGCARIRRARGRAGEILMNTPAFILAILGALWLGAMLPGPSFVIARSAIGQSRLDGLASALGMGIGGILFASLALAGLYSVLQTVGWLYLGLKLAGGAYLLYMSYKIWRGASQPFALPGAVAARSGSARKSFWTGLATQMSNPKTAIWYGSIFAALLPQQPPAWVYFALPPLVFLVEFGWYAIVALCFGPGAEGHLPAREEMVDRLAACAMAALGLRLILTARKSGL